MPPVKWRLILIHRHWEMKNRGISIQKIHSSMFPISGVFYRFQDLLRSSWILPWLLGSSGFVPGLWDYGDIASKHWAPECIPVHTEDVSGKFRGMLLSCVLRGRKRMTSMNQSEWHTLAFKQTNQGFLPIYIHPFAVVEDNPIADKSQRILLSSTYLKSFGAQGATLVELGATWLEARIEWGLVHGEMLALQFRQGQDV